MSEAAAASDSSSSRYQWDRYVLPKTFNTYNPGRRVVLEEKRLIYNFNILPAVFYCISLPRGHPAIPSNMVQNLQVRRRRFATLFLLCMSCPRTNDSSSCSGISVHTQLLLALSYLAFYFLPLFGPHRSFLPYIPSLAIIFFMLLPLYTLYLLHTRSRIISPCALLANGEASSFMFTAICLGLALAFKNIWDLWGGKWGEGVGQRVTGAYGVGWLCGILWAFGMYLGAVGVWPQLVECEREGRAELMRDRWLMVYLGLLYLSAGMKVLVYVAFPSFFFDLGQ